MFTIRNLGAASLFLFGTTFLWLTPAFVSKGLSTDGPMWSATNVLALVTIAGFSIATLGLLRRATWWEASAIASTVIGVVTLLAYAVASRDLSEPGKAMNVFVHVVGTVGVSVLLLVPTLERWVSEQVHAG